MTTKARLVFTLPALALCTWLSAALGASSGLTTELVVPKVLIPPGRFKLVPRVLQFNSRFVVLDQYNHRVLILKETIEYDRQIAQIGQDPGALYQPYDLVIGDTGLVYVLDKYGRRIQVFDWNGNLVRQISPPGVASTIAVNSKGEVLACIPSTGSLVTVFDEHGKIRRSFGKLKRASEVYGPAMESKDELYRIGLNHVRICVDEVDNVYLAFEAIPIIQKYSASNSLIFEKRLPGEQAAQTIAVFAQTTLSPIRHAYVLDGISTPWVITGMASSRIHHVLFVCLQWSRGWIYALNTDGETLAILEWGDEHLLFQKPYVSESRQELLLPAASSKLGAGIYEIDIAPFFKKFAH